MAKDLFHDSVKVALQKEGWEITHDPLMLESLETQIFVDLGAEQVIGAQRDKELIAVEIKSFWVLHTYMIFIRLLVSI